MESMGSSSERLAELLRKHEADLLAEWLKEQLANTTMRSNLLDEAALGRQSKEFLALLKEASQTGNVTDINRPEWGRLRDLLASLSRSRAESGFSPSETAAFVMSLKQPVFSRVQQDVGQAPQVLAEDLWTISVLLDKLGLYTMEFYQKGREAMILRQQQEILELSTPVVRVWEGILLVPLIGTLDSARTQVVMESLLQAIVETGSDVAIIDITGVPAVDTQVSQHLLKTVAAARLMGAECIISGIRPQIAQTMIGLGVTFDVVTKNKLADALQVALKHVGLNIVAV